MYAPETGSFQIPSEGPHQAVCVDVVDIGLQPGYEGKGLVHKIVLVFQVDEESDKGERLTLESWLTLSMNEKSNLRKLIEAWRGKAFGKDEAGVFDIETVIGANAQINVQHYESNGKTRAKIASIMPILKGMEKMKPAGYKRREYKTQVADAPGKQGTVAKVSGFQQDDEVPF
jgi:hypothetical protein